MNATKLPFQEQKHRDDLVGAVNGQTMWFGRGKPKLLEGKMLIGFS